MRSAFGRRTGGLGLHYRCLFQSTHYLGNNRKRWVLDGPDAITLSRWSSKDGNLDIPHAKKEAHSKAHPLQSTALENKELH